MYTMYCEDLGMSVRFFFMFLSHYILLSELSKTLARLKYEKKKMMAGFRQVESQFMSV